MIRITLALSLIVILAGCALQPAGIPTAIFHYETDDLAQVTDAALEQAALHGRDKVLVVFDIDNTLLAMEQGLGSDQWYYWQKDLQAAAPCDPTVAANLFAVQGALFHASAMRPTQPDAAEQVRRLQDAGLDVIALTSRGSDYRLQTFRELRRADISFWPSALPPQRGFGEAFIPQGGTRPALYEDGVFLTAGQHKGEMLKALMDLTQTGHPRVIVMADDKQFNLDAVAETFKNLSFAVHLYRYGREDAVVAAFDADEAARLWLALMPPLQQIQSLLGPYNFDLAGPVRPEGCP